MIKNKYDYFMLNLLYSVGHGERQVKHRNEEWSITGSVSI